MVLAAPRPVAFLAKAEYFHGRGVKGRLLRRFFVTRSLDGKLHRGRTGVAWLALTTRAPVVPAALSGTQHLQPVGARLPRIRPVTVRFGAPRSFDELDNTARTRRAVTDRIMTESRPSPVRNAPTSTTRSAIRRR